MLIRPQTPAGKAGLSSLLESPSHALVCLDYDGTLAPIVDDPTRALPHPDVVGVLAALAQRVGGVAIVTGRPAGVAVDLSGVRGVQGLERLVVMGHYGMERWDARTDEISTQKVPPGVDQARRLLPGILDELGLPGATVEDKGLAVAVHVRRTPDPQAAFAAMEPRLRALADEVGLAAEPGRLVMELRPAGMDKGTVVRRLTQEAAARCVMFVGDDRGDLAAFDEVDRFRRGGGPGLLVCSASTEVTVLTERADVVVDGPAGVARLLGALVDAIMTAQRT